MTEKDVYQFYTEKIKILYSEIEAQNNILPIELLFEILAAFDHLKRFHIDNESEENCAAKAYSHLKRGALDAFKLKLKYHNCQYNKIMQPNKDLRLIDTGNFLPSMLNAHREITQTAKNARLTEGVNDIDKAFENWEKTSLLIDDFEDTYFNSEKLDWAKTQNIVKKRNQFLMGIITGVFASAIFAGIINLVKYFC